MQNKIVPTHSVKESTLPSDDTSSLTSAAVAAMEELWGSHGSSAMPSKDEAQTELHSTDVNHSTASLRSKLNEYKERLQASTTPPKQA